MEDRVMTAEMKRVLASFGCICDERGRISRRLTCLWAPKMLTYIRTIDGKDEELVLPGDLDAIRKYLLKGLRIHPKEVPPFPPQDDKAGRARVEKRANQYREHRAAMTEWQGEIRAGKGTLQPEPAWENEETFTCELCGKPFSSKLALAGHQGAHQKTKATK